MAYKFQVGSGSLGGSMRVGPVVGTGSVTAEGLISGSGNLNIQGDAAVGAALNVTGAVSGAAIQGTAGTLTSLALQTGGITAAGSIAGATTIAASGLANLDGGIEIDSAGNKFTVSSAGAVMAVGTLDVTGAVNLNSALDVGGALRADSTISGTLIDGTTIGGTSLNLQSGGGTDLGALSGISTVTMTGLLSSSAKANFIGNAAFGGTLSVTGALSGAATVAGATGQFRGSVAETPAVDTDSLAWFETDGTLKKVTFALYANELAGTGITATDGVLSVDTTGGDSVTVALLAVSGTAAAGMNYMATISSSVSVKLPAGPTAGDVVYIKAGAGVDPTASPVADITIECQGSHKVDNEGAVVLESPYGSIGLIYVDTNLWRII